MCVASLAGSKRRGRRTTSKRSRNLEYLENRDYLPQYALPNFYVHVATADNLLRASGVEVGKSDELGPQAWKKA
jgi:hypothetical protein